MATSRNGDSVHGFLHRPEVPITRVSFYMPLG
jgi:hypothetical protein